MLPTLAFALLLAAPAPQTTVVIDAHDSKCMSPSGQNWNDNRFRAYWNSSTSFVDGVAKFDLTSIPDGATITAMTLRAYHEAGYSNPYNDPEVAVYRSATDSWARGATDPHPGLNEVLTPPYIGFPSTDLTPVDFVLNVGAVNWAADLADNTLTLLLRNEAGNLSRYSYVYFYGSDSAPAPPELIITYTSGPSLTISNLVGGSVAAFTVANATPGGLVGVGASLHGGGPSTFSTPCGALSVQLTPPIVLVGKGPANGAGSRTFSVNVPAGLSGRQLWSQGLDIPGCRLTNAVTQVIG